MDLTSSLGGWGSATRPRPCWSTRKSPDRPRWHNQTVLERRICNAAAGGKVLGYDFNRMVVDFTMFNQGKTVRCAISTAAMDDLEGKHEVKADQRVDQFLRLRDAIEERASRKFFERPVHAEGPVVLRSNDFFK